MRKNGQTDNDKHNHSSQGHRLELRQLQHFLLSLYHAQNANCWSAQLQKRRGSSHYIFLFLRAHAKPAAAPAAITATDAGPVLPTGPEGVTYGVTDP